VDETLSPAITSSAKKHTSPSSVVCSVEIIGRLVNYKAATMMKSILFLLTLFASAAAFAPQFFGVRETNT
jgi:hypothetical protein